MSFDYFYYMLESITLLFSKVLITTIALPNIFMVSMETFRGHHISLSNVGILSNKNRAPILHSVVQND